MLTFVTSIVNIFNPLKVKGITNYTLIVNKQDTLIWKEK